MKDEFYIPMLDNIRVQSPKNKQCSEGNVEEAIATDFISTLKGECKHQYESYLEDIEHGIAREQARIKLPQNLYTEFYWTIDLHNLLHFLALRADSHAQQEIQVYANAIIDLIKPIIPITIEAWEDYHEMRGGILLTKLEVEAIQKSLSFINENYAADINACYIESDNKREQEEWLDKANRLGFN